ncbi:MAG: polymer-forming cytoskeletal protein [Pseudomonadota bacterium]
MFNSNNRGREAAPGLPPAPQPQAGGQKRGMFSVIGPDMIITGNIAATADLHIDGRVDGDVTCGSLVQGPDSRIKGTVKAESARLAGAIEGSVSVRQLTIERAARITGDVEYENIAIENGASIDGRLKHIAADAVRAVPSPLASHHSDSVTQFPTAAGEAA